MAEGRSLPHSEETERAVLAVVKAAEHPEAGRTDISTWAKIYRADDKFPTWIAGAPGYPRQTGRSEEEARWKVQQLIDGGAKPSRWRESYDAGLTLDEDYCGLCGENPGSCPACEGEQKIGSHDCQECGGSGRCQGKAHARAASKTGGRHESR